MRFSFRSIRRNWHLLVRTKEYALDGVWLSTDPKSVPRAVSSLIFRHTYEDVERDLIKRVLKPDSRVLEIGCGIGLVSLVARKIAKNGHVRSYEANPTMETLIRTNYSLNALEPDLVMKAITIDGDDLEFFVDQNILSSSAIDRGRGDKKTKIKSDRFDTVIEDFKPETIIMDVEGAEISLLGNGEMKGIKNLVVELHPHIVGEEAISELLKGMEAKGFHTAEKRGKVYWLERK